MSPSARYHLGYHKNVKTQVAGPSQQDNVLRLCTFGGLWIEQSNADAGSAVRPRGLALLAILAAAEANRVSRDRLIGLLWPESNGERARHTLSQTLYGLRRSLGAEVVQFTPELRLDTSRITADVVQFRAAVRSGNWEEAASVYVGPFLDGFYLGDAPEFERWVEQERAALATDGIRAIEALAMAAEQRGDSTLAVEQRRRLTQLDPFNPRFAVTYMEGLAREGNREAALAHGKTHSVAMQREFEAEADATVEQLMQRLRGSANTPSRAQQVVTPGVTEATNAPTAASASVAARGSPIRLTVPVATTPRARTTVMAGIALVVGLMGVAWTTARARAAAQPVLAVGRIRDLVAPDSVAVSAVLSEMLSTSLGRLSDLRVVANSRMMELNARDTSRSAMSDAARRAGATQLIEGELLPIANRQLQMEIRRVDLRRGLVLGGYRVTGSDRFALFDSVTSLIAADFRVEAPSGSLAAISTRSPIAYRFYDEGLRAYYQFEPRSALRLFRSAIREDTSFAMAYYYAWRAAAGIADPETQDLGMRAIELAARAGPRDRLLILTHLGAASSDPRALAAAETLATNYPNDPEALVRAGEVARDVSQATRLLNQSIAIDSAAGVVPKSICRMCFALSSLAGRYAWEDSLGAAITTMRRWIRLRPGDGIAWCGLADYMTADGNRAAADSATRRCDAAGGFGANQHLAQLVSMLRFEDVAAANRECRDGLATMDLPAYEQYRWYCTIALRMQGRMREAQLLARQGRSGVFGLRVAPHGFNGPSVINEPILLTETGNPAAAVPMFRRMYPETYAPNKRLPEGTVARNATWTMTLAATAAADAGDTVLARAYVDSIANMGQRSLFPRDPMLHHFVRGLLHARAGQLEQAVTEYRRAIVSPAYGYTRMNVELARTLLALNRPMEGIPVIRAALHGGIEGSNLYVTRTELHEVLAQLHAAAGQRDSAAVHYAFVERAWRSADPQYRSRYEAARAAVSVAATR